MICVCEFTSCKRSTHTTTILCVHVCVKCFELIMNIKDLIFWKQHSSTLPVLLGPGHPRRALDARKSTSRLARNEHRPRKRHLGSTRKHSLETDPETVTWNHSKTRKHKTPRKKPSECTPRKKLSECTKMKPKSRSQRASAWQWESHNYLTFSLLLLPS